MGNIISFFRTINWSIFAFLGTGVILTLIIIGLILSPYINFYAIFNIARILSGILLAPFFIFLVKFLNGRTENYGLKSKILELLALISGLITAISLTLGGLFTMQKAPFIHILAGFFFNFGIVFFCFFCAFSELTIPEFPKKLVIIGFMVDFLTIIFMISFLLSFLMGLSETIMFFFEWISFLAFIIWILIQGFYTLK